MNAYQGDPRIETEAALIAFLLAAADLAARLDARSRAAGPVGSRVALDILAARLPTVRAAAEDAYSAVLFSD